MSDSSTEPEGRQGEPWIRYRESSLYVVPSVHFRLPFAQQVYRACLRKPFDVIALELPACYQSAGLVKAALRLGPMPGIVIHPAGEAFPLAAPRSSHPDCRDVRILAVRPARVLPLSPCDSLATALRCPSLLSVRWPAWQPTLDFIDATPVDSPTRRTLPELPDPYEIDRCGLAVYQRRIDELGEDVPVDAVDERREAIMATRLRAYLDAGKEVLFVCGAAHWRRIAALLDGEEGNVEEPANTSPAASLITATVRPDVAWRFGWLDAMPHVAWRFQQSCANHSADSFDARAEVSRLIAESIDATSARRRCGISLRRLAVLTRCHEWLLASRRRRVPDLDDLIQVAESCVGEALADTLVAKGLAFPAPRPAGISHADIRSLGGDRYLAVIGDQGYQFELPSAGTEGGPRWAFSSVKGQDESEPEWWRRHQGPAPLSEQEEAERQRGSGYLRTWPPEIRLLRRMRLRAESLLRSEDRVTRSRKFQGTMFDGPAWRGTIASFARGDRSLYVKQHVVRQGRPPVSRNQASPVVWVFDAEARISGRQCAEDRLTDQQWYKTGFFYLTSSTYLAGGGIRRFEMAAMADLGLGCLLRTGVDWNTDLGPAELAAAIADYLGNLPPDKRCAQAFWNDPELARFEGVDQIIAGAVKYAADQVILIGATDRPLPAAVREFARKRQVKIRRLASDLFSPDSLERLRVAHYVPSPQDTFQPPFAWVGRFVRPVGPPME